MTEMITAGDHAYATIRAMIVAGELVPGEQLVQRALAERIGTSHIPVIEAIRRLASDGMVICNPKWGARVRTWSLEDIRAAYVIREALEGHACRLFIDHASKAQREELREFGRKFDECSVRGDRTQCGLLDIDLHMHIVRCTDSQYLRQLAENSCIIVATIRNTLDVPLAPGANPGPAGVHDHLIETLMGDDPDLAEREGRAHVATGARKFIEGLRTGD
jgi:DNA-binding GntR family transcriptional regulator